MKSGWRERRGFVFGHDKHLKHFKFRNKGYSREQIYDTKNSNNTRGIIIVKNF